MLYQGLIPRHTSLISPYCLQNVPAILTSIKISQIKNWYVTRLLQYRLIIPFTSKIPIVLLNASVRLRMTRCVHAVSEVEDQGAKPATICQIPSSSPTGPSPPRKRDSRQCGVVHRWTGMAWGHSLEVNSSQAGALFHSGRNPSISFKDSPGAEKAKWENKTNQLQQTESMPLMVTSDTWTVICNQRAWALVSLCTIKTRFYYSQESYF